MQDGESANCHASHRIPASFKYSAFSVGLPYCPQHLASGTFNLFYTLFTK